MPGNELPVPARSDEITALLRAHGAGDRRALERLTPLVYEELRAIARRQLGHESDGITLQTTGLVHEAFMKLVAVDRIQLNDRSHFFALAARLMRQILTDHARRRRALKRDPAAMAGGAEEPDGIDPESLLDLDAALRRLAELSPRGARIVECRFFAGMTVEETGQALSLSPATVKRDWQVARAWLNRELVG